MAMVWPTNLVLRKKSSGVLFSDEKKKKQKQEVSEPEKKTELAPAEQEEDRGSKSGSGPPQLLPKRGQKVRDFAQDKMELSLFNTMCDGKEMSLQLSQSCNDD